MFPPSRLLDYYFAAIADIYALAVRLAAQTTALQVVPLSLAFGEGRGEVLDRCGSLSVADSKTASLNC
jgi:hypothetical protein